MVCLGGEVGTMKPPTYQMVKLALEADDTIVDADRQHILAVCRDPALALPRPEQPSIPASRWLTPRQAAESMSMSLRSVQRLIRNGSLPSRRISGCRRIPADAIGNPPAPLPRKPGCSSPRPPPLGGTPPAECEPDSSSGTTN